jgi:cell division septation protein DedD
MRRPRFQLSERLAEKLEKLRVTNIRRYRACCDIIRKIGQHCVDRLLDEVTEQDLRRINDASRWRVMRGYVELLLGCGALEVTPWGTYAIPFFLDGNLPAYLRATKNREIMDKEKLASLAYRRRHQKVVEPSIGSLMKTSTYPQRHAETRSVVKEVNEKNLTNNTTAETEVRAKRMPPSVVRSETEVYDFAAAARRMMTGVDPTPELDSTPIANPTIETKAANRTSVTSAPRAPRFPQAAAFKAAASKPSGICKPALIPDDPILANMGTAIGALKNFGICNLARAEQFFTKLWRDKVRDVEVGHAVWCTHRQQHVKGQRIHSVEAYMMGIIRNQRRYRSLPQSHAHTPRRSRQAGRCPTERYPSVCQPRCG